MIDQSNIINLFTGFIFFIILRIAYRVLF